MDAVVRSKQARRFVSSVIVRQSRTSRTLGVAAPTAVGGAAHATLHGHIKAAATAKLMLF
jgi:hypothetical protein